MLEKRIYLNNLAENVATIKRLTNQNLIAVIKSNAYGFGSSEVAHYLASIGVTYFAVNDISEAIELLNSNLKANILLLNSVDATAFPFLEQHQELICSINSLEDIAVLVKCQASTIRVHLQIDSGMNRLGIRSGDEYFTCLSLTSQYEKFNLEGIYTHLYSSNFEKCNKQLEEFYNLAKYYSYNMIHLASSSTLNFTEISNYVRVGLGLYTALPQQREVLEVVTKPIWVKKFMAGTSFGYEQDFKLAKDSYIALLPIGYANGISRALEGFTVIANERKHTIIGKICMNHLYITADESINLDTLIYLFNSEQTVNDAARFLKTTPHEICCMLQIEDVKYIYES